MTLTATEREMLAGDGNLYASPPTTREKYLYIKGRQGRWLYVFQYCTFLAVAISFFGFARTSYWTLVFLFVLALMMFEQTIALYVSTRRRRVSLETHLSKVASWHPEAYPSVDVYLPTCGEELDLIHNTMRYLRKLRWSGTLEIWILDDSGRAAVQQMAEEFGFNYIARPGSEYKKAGNLRYAMERTSGAFVAILDADFVPRSDFISELIPYFEEDVGIVQSPQFFDTSKEQTWVRRAAGATQELFYRYIQTSRDRHNAAICVGSCAIYRRAHLDAIGGFPKMTNSEDIWTGYQLDQYGFRTVYVPIVVSKGVCPDTIDNFIAQQYRWCEGSMRMIGSRNFHVNPTMSLPTRLGYWSGFLYYIGTAVTSLTMPLPATIMAVIYAGYVRWWNTLWMIGLPLLWLIVWPLTMRTRWRFEVLRVQTVYGFAHLFNIIDLLKRQPAEWHPTQSKAPAPIAVRVKRFYTVYLGIGLLVMVGSVATRAAEYGTARFAGMIVFALMNVYVAGPLVYSGLRDELRARRSRMAAVTLVDSISSDLAA